MDKKRPSGEQNLVVWARPHLADKRKLHQIVDPRLEMNYSLKGVQKVSQLAFNCLSKDSKSRPTMDEVVKVLDPLQDLNDLAINHSRLSQGRRKKKDGTPQLTYNQSKSIRDSPLNIGKQHCRWWAANSPWLAQYYLIKDRLALCHLFQLGNCHKNIFQACIIFGCLNLPEQQGQRKRKGTSVFLFLGPYIRVLTINLEHSILAICLCCNWAIYCN